MKNLKDYIIESSVSEEISALESMEQEKNYDLNLFSNKLKAALSKIGAKSISIKDKPSKDFSVSFIANGYKTTTNFTPNGVYNDYNREKL